MKHEEQIFIFASPAIQLLLADNSLSFTDLLEAEGQPVNQTIAENPATDSDEGYKEPATVIIASAALVLALTPLLTKALDKLTHKSVIATELVLVPVLDANGEAVRDSLGEPVLYWAEKHKIIESDSGSNVSNVTISGYGVKVTYDESGEEG